MAQKKDIKYINKDFSTFRADLIEYARAYFPTVYNDFNQASPGSMFIEMSSYIGDVLSFYLDNQIQESFVQFAKQKNNLFPLAYMLGYRPKVVAAALVDLEVFQTVPSVLVGSEYQPDFSYAFIVSPGMTATSNINAAVNFYVPSKIDFTYSSSVDPTEVITYQLAGTNPDSYLLKKTIQAVSGQLKTQTFTFGSAVRYQTVTINEPDIVSIVNVTDSDGNIWYEVPYLAQDFIYNSVPNIAANYPNLYQFANQVPYILEKVQVDRRFTTRFQSDESLIIEFGAGVNDDSDNAVLPDPATAGLGLTVGLNTLTASWDPTNFLTTKTYGLAPNNTTLTFQYLAGGGAQYNVLANQLTIPGNVVPYGNTTFANTLAINNPNPASGGGDGDTIEEIRLNSLGEFMSQMRAVTQQDYLSRATGMPAKYGKVSKAYVTKDDATFANYYVADTSVRDQVLVSLYVLGLSADGSLGTPSAALLQNLQTYLADYRMLTDAVNIKPAYIINIGCNFDVIIRPNFNGQDVIARCLAVVKNFFSIDNWQINEPIVLGDLYTLIDTVEGVQTVKSVEITNKSGGSYSQYSYDIPGATLNGVVYPSLDPSILEVKFPDTDIQGRVVTF